MNFYVFQILANKIDSSEPITFNLFLFYRLFGALQMELSEVMIILKKE